PTTCHIMTYTHFAPNLDHSTANDSSFFLYACDHVHDLHSFPTRRSSDLLGNVADVVDAPEPPIGGAGIQGGPGVDARAADGRFGDRKSTRLNSSHVKISYAVFCLKKKKKKQETCRRMNRAQPCVDAMRQV